MKKATWSVYIMCNVRQTVLYTGITNSLSRRIFEHRTSDAASFTRQYNVTQLVYFEDFDNPRDAIYREKQIKSWGRKKKRALIETLNPKWEDRSKDLLVICGS